MPTKVHIVKTTGFPSSRVWMWELDHKEGWASENWCFWIVVLEKTAENPLDCKEIKPVNPKGNKSWIFIQGADVEAKTPILWRPNAKSQLTIKDRDAGHDWGQEENGVTEDEMVGKHHWLNEHEFEQTSGDSEGLGSLMGCSPWAHEVWHNLATKQHHQKFQESRNNFL